jgi:psiF repeat
MIISRILPAAGFLTLLTCAAFAQTPQIPVGAGANLHRPGIGSHTAVRPNDRCSRQADAKRLHGNARRAFLRRCK